MYVQWYEARRVLALGLGFVGGAGPLAARARVFSCGGPRSGVAGSCRFGPHLNRAQLRQLGNVAPLDIFPARVLAGALRIAPTGLWLPPSHGHVFSHRRPNGWQWSA